MKRIVVLMLSLALITVSVDLHAQIRKVPAAVTDAFKAKYPEASGVEFKDKLTYFQVNFQLNGVPHQAKFNSKGEWDQTEKTIADTDLPAAVKDGFSKSKYTDWETTETAWVQHKDGHIEYRLLVKKSTLEKKYLYFNESGKLLKDSITL